MTFVSKLLEVKKLLYIQNENKIIQELTMQLYTEGKTMCSLIDVGSHIECHASRIDRWKFGTIVRTDR